jgi:conjugal transfer/entry exclusion protein
MRDSSRASAYLHDEFFLELVENQRTLYKNNIFNSADNDVEIRERNFIKLKVLDELIASIQAVSDDKQIVDKKWKIF